MNTHAHIGGGGGGIVHHTIRPGWWTLTLIKIHLYNSFISTGEVQFGPCSVFVDGQFNPI